MIYVITNPELGWDCVIGVVDELTDELQKFCDERDWVIHYQYRKVQFPKAFMEQFE